MSTIDQHRGPWRFEELATLPDDGRRYEVVDGVLVVTPPPTQRHQFVGSVLLHQLVRACPPQWRVVDEWPLPLGTDGRVPDLAVVAADAPVTRAGSAYPAGPEHVGLLVEVVSPSSRKTDRVMKPAEHAEAGVPLFWRVETDPDCCCSPTGSGRAATSRWRRSRSGARHRCRGACSRSTWPRREAGRAEGRGRPA